jgi:hypothetical protein
VLFCRYSTCLWADYISSLCSGRATVEWSRTENRCAYRIRFARTDVRVKSSVSSAELSHIGSMLEWPVGHFPGTGWAILLCGRGRGRTEKLATCELSRFLHHGSMQLIELHYATFSAYWPVYIFRRILSLAALASVYTFDFICTEMLIIIIITKIAACQRS